jgi:transposase
MKRYIGMDVHAASTTMAVLSATGKVLRTMVVETNGQTLVEALKGIAGELHVCLEEGTQSAWLYEILSPHVAELVVTGINEESRGQKSDQIDAVKLAEQLRTGRIDKQVYKDRGTYRELRELGRVHAVVVRDVVRVQTRLKSLYRSRGVQVVGKAVYGEKKRGEYLQHLPSGSRQAAETLYGAYDALEEVRDRAEAQLVEESRRHSISRVLGTCPGMGPIRVARMIPIVMTPERFRTTRQFWSYCGLGIVMRSSSDWVHSSDGKWQRAQVMQTRGLNYNHNRQLEVIFKGAATTVINQLPDEPLHAAYKKMLEQGTKPNLAKLTLARKIAATTLALWKKQEAYDPEKVRKLKQIS